MRREFRVRWQREGQQPKRALYQTEKGAERCAERQRTAREEMDWLDDPDSPYSSGRPPEIVAGPTIESREVGEWEPVS